ncbi:MAG: reverse transcriptase domain-containing protein [Sedimenticola sp.]
MNKKKYPTLVQKVNLRAITVKCNGSVTVPAFSEIIIDGESTGRIGTKYGLVSPLEECDQGFMVGHTLVDPNRSDSAIPIRILNPSPSDIIIKEGENIACINGVDEVESGHVSSECDTQCSNSDKICVDQELPEHLIDLFECSSEHLIPEEKAQLKSLLIKHSATFAKSSDDLGHTSVVKHKIDTGDNQPVKQRPRRPPFAFAEEESKIIKNQLKMNVIRESSSAWASPLVYVRKRDGTTRPCVDYRLLNAATKKDAYPLPNLNDCLDHLGGATHYSCLDVLSAYYQIEVDAEDRQKTAFVCKQGLYEYNVMPFGLCNAASTFQRCMELILCGLQWHILLIYLDDVIVYGKTFSEHLQRLDVVLTRLFAAGMKLKASKCVLLRKEVAFLGHLVTEGGVKPLLSKVKAIKQWPVPKNVTGVRSFIGFCSYYRRFIRGFAARAKPLHRLLEAEQPFEWSSECQHSFCDLKSALTGEEVLAFPRDDAGMFIVDCDASDYAIGCVLSQMQWCEKSQQMEERPICFASKSLTKPQRAYCCTRREMLAVVVYLQEFRQYLLGRKFLVRTDHSSLRWIMSFKNPENQMARWIEVLSQFDFVIEHRKGTKHVNADALSRIQCDPADCSCYDGTTILHSLPCGGCKGCVKKHREWSVLQEIDDVVPLISKRISVTWPADFYHYIVMYISVVCTMFGHSLDYIKRFLGLLVRCIFSLHKRRMIMHLRANQESAAPATKKRTDVGIGTLEKDFGMSTHAGGLFPSGDSSSTSVIKPRENKNDRPFSNWIGSYSNTDIAKMQLDDPDIGPVLRWQLASSDRPSRDSVAGESPYTRNMWLYWSQLCVKNGVLFKRWVSTDSKEDYDQLVLPTILQKDVMKLVHSALPSAHLGVNKTVEKLRLSFYWFRMSDSVRQWIKQCDFCGERKKPVKGAKAPLQKYTVGYPMDRVSTDVLGPFPISESGNRYILVVMCNFTKYVEAYAIPDQTAKTVANKLVFEFFSRMGIPLDILSDQGTNYQSELFRQMCILLEINQTRTSAFRPSANGMVERFNQSLLNMITSYVNEEQTNWDTYLPLMTSAYRSCVHPSTGQTPNKLMFGREVNLPVHFLVGSAPHRNSAGKTYCDYVVILEEKMSKIYNLVRHKLKVNAERQKQSYDTRISTHNYEVGDLVYCVDTTRKIGRSPKLKRYIWRGPMIIVRKISDLLFEVKSKPKAKTKILHHDRLKLFCGQTIPQWILASQQELKVMPFSQGKIIKQKKSTATNTRRLNGDGHNEERLRRSKRKKEQPNRLSYSV